MTATHAEQNHRHACWVVNEDIDLARLAARSVAEAARRRMKTVAFGPPGSVLLNAVGKDVCVKTDPHESILGRGPLDPDAMFSAFREHEAVASSEGYDGLYVVADMDWLLPARPGKREIVAFEVLLDRVVAELGVTVDCAYRSHTYDAAAIEDVLCVHPVSIGSDGPRPFSLVAGEDDVWLLSGELDLTCADAFAAAFSAAARDGGAFDVAKLGFADVAGMRAIAEAATTIGQTVRLLGASSCLQRHWTLAGFDAVAPQVELA